MFLPKVVQPARQIPQMKSDVQQPPFYFGGSQVPSSVGVALHGQGVKSKSFTMMPRTIQLRK